MRRLLVAAALAAALPAAAWAHHGWTAFDSAKQQKLTGTIEKMAFANPHGELWMTVDGKRMYVELSPPARMVARGLVADDLAVGKSVTVEAQPNLKDELAWKAQAITLDGKTYSLMREPGGP